MKALNAVSYQLCVVVLYRVQYCSKLILKFFILRDFVVSKLTVFFFFFFLFPTKGKLARLRLLNINFNNFIFDFVELDLFPELIGTEEIIKVS